VRIPGWHMLAATSVALALLLLGLFYVHSGSLRTRGRTLLALVVYASATGTVWVIYDFTQQYMTVSSVIAGVLLLLGMLGVLLVLLAEAQSGPRRTGSSTDGGSERRSSQAARSRRRSRSTYPPTTSRRRC